MPDNNTKGLSAQRELYKELSKLWVGVGILLEGEEGILMVLRDNIPNIQYPNHYLARIPSSLVLGGIAFPP